MVNTSRFKRILPWFALGALAVAGLAGVWYQMSRPLPGSPAPAGGDAANGSGLKTYKDRDSGFSFSYPGSWVIETERGTLTFSDPANLTEEINIAVSDAKYRTSVSGSFAGYTAVPVTVDKVSGTRYFSNADTLQAALVVKGGRLYYLSGHSERFLELVSGFKFLE